MAAEWYFKSGGTEFGPVSVAELVQQAADGKVVPETEVRKADGPWVPASKVANLFDRAAQIKPSPVVTTPNAAPDQAASSSHRPSGPRPLPPRSATSR